MHVIVCSRNRISRIVAEEAVPWGLAGIQDPDLPRDILSLGFIKGLQILEGKVSLSIDLTTPACPARKQIRGGGANDRGCPAGGACDDLPPPAFPVPPGSPEVDRGTPERRKKEIA